MTRKINGVPGNGGLGDSKSDYLSKIRGVTKKFHLAILRWAKRYRDQALIFFRDSPPEIILEKPWDLQKEALLEYENIYYIYRLDSKTSTAHCKFASLPEKQMGLDLSKCQLHQLGTVVVTVIDASDLANKITIYLAIMVEGKPELTNNLRHLLECIETWKMDDRETLESQLLREMSLIDNPHLGEVFSVLLRELGPKLERRFLLYEGCASFGSRQCLLCDEHFANANPKLEQFPLPNFENTTDPRHFYWSIFRQIFYESLLDFLKRVQSD